MEKEIEVTLENSGKLNGLVKMKKPNAGKRNKALIAAEKPTGGISEIKFAVEYLPYCIKEHPWGMRVVKEALEELEDSDYDKLLLQMQEFTPSKELKKK